MYDGVPEDYNDHLQSVGKEILNGSLDKVGAVIRLVRLGWNHEEAHAAVVEIVEQVETTKKLLRDAARVLDDSPSGQARASGRLREAGFSGNDADQIVAQIKIRRDQSAGQSAELIAGIRQSKLNRAQAVEQLVVRGMDPLNANIKVDVATDSASHWASEWFILTLAISIAAMVNVVAICSFMLNEVLDWLGFVLIAFVGVTMLALYWSWKNHRFWQDWTLLHQSQRDCPRSCNPIVMLAQGKGRRAAIMTSMEWGMSRHAASELVRVHGDFNVGIYNSWIIVGVSILLISLASSIYCVIHEPQHLVLITILETVMSTISAFMICKGIQGRRNFAKQ